ATPHRICNWLVPLLLVCLSCLLVLTATWDRDRTASMINVFSDAEKLTPEQATPLSAHWVVVSGVAICLGAIGGTFWSALVLWLIGRVVLRSRFGFLKALEVVSLSATVLILGGVVTALLVSATGDATARPALSLLCARMRSGSAFQDLAGLLDCF